MSAEVMRHVEALSGSAMAVVARRGRAAGIASVEYGLRHLKTAQDRR